MQHQTALALEFKDGFIVGGDESLTLFFDGHVQITVSHTIFSDVVVADQILPLRCQNGTHLSVQSRHMSLVADFVHRLVGDHEIKYAD